mmetsp:Transcript_30928/g.62719  ORF Transcript_30928/g.62719 Transcript_30928/m.62719 type:complete len:109 (-) Transcript_30928:413-739(-)
MIARLLLDAADARRLSFEVNIAASSKLSGMAREDRPSTNLFGLHKGLACKPIVCVNDVEVLAHKCLSFANEPNESVAHVVALPDKIGIQFYRNVMHMNIVNNIVTSAF